MPSGWSVLALREDASTRTHTLRVDAIELPVELYTPDGAKQLSVEEIEISPLP